MGRRHNVSESTYYTKKFKWLKTCVYCGEPAQCLDHVFPLSLSAKLDMHRSVVQCELRGGLYRVPSCNECNGLAGDEPFTSILGKRRFIQARLREKYRGSTKRVLWDYDELMELGPTLRSKIVSDMHKMESAEIRFLYPRFRSRASNFLDKVQSKKMGR